MPSDATYQIGMLANASAYVSDTIGGTGHLKVTVSPADVTVDFVRAFLPADTLTGVHRNGEVAFRYTVNKGTSGISASPIETVSVQVYPNPARDRVFIGLKDSTEKIHHQPVMKKNLILILVACHLPAFIYGQKFTEILGRPTGNSVTMSILFEASVKVYRGYGTSPGNYSLSTGYFNANKEVPFEGIFPGLIPDMKYHYRTRFRAAGTTGPFLAGPGRHFFFGEATGC